MPRRAASFDREGYCDMLVAAGMEAAEAERMAEIQAQEHAALDAGRCPRCGQPLVGTLDERQAGAAKAAEFQWYNYRCGCGYAEDRAEAECASSA